MDERDERGDPVARYHEVWRELRAATAAADALLHAVPPEALTQACADAGEAATPVGREVYALLDWLRAVATAAERRERRRRLLMALDAPAPRPAGPRPVLLTPLRIGGGEPGRCSRPSPGHRAPPHGRTVGA